MYSDTGSLISKLSRKNYIISFKQFSTFRMFVISKFLSDQILYRYEIQCMEFHHSVYGVFHTNHTRRPCLVYRWWSRARCIRCAHVYARARLRTRVTARRLRAYLITRNGSVHPNAFCRSFLLWSFLSVCLNQAWPVLEVIP